MTRILGGYKISIEEAPYQVNYGDICGGVLIHEMWVLTCAHCGTEANFIRVGSSHRLRGLQVKVSFHKLHPNYQLHHTYDFDVQLLRLNRRLRFSSRIQALDMGGAHDNNVLVSGWGYPREKTDYSEDLHQVRLKLVPMTRCQLVDRPWYNHTLTERMFCAGGLGKDACQTDYSEVLHQVRLKLVPMTRCQLVSRPWYNHTLTERMFCAGGLSKDACQGDSGGAAVSLGRIVGLSSFGFGCGRNIPGVYTNVSHVEIRQWIRGFTGV